MKIISLTKGYSTVVNSADFKSLSRFKWYALTSNTGPIYAARKGWTNGKPHVVLMHRQILGTPEGLKTDHRNGDSLDNRRRNLRVATNQQNQRGFMRPRVGKTSRFRGVCLPSSEKKWRAQISVNRKVKYLGDFLTEMAAARAYDAAARKFFGKFASPNFK